MSPRTGPSQISSAPSQSPLPPQGVPLGSGGPSPIPTPPSRPPNLMTGHQHSASIPTTPVPSTPSRPMQANVPPPFLSGAASVFTPRGASKAVKIAREDGTAVNMKEVAEAASKAVSSGAHTPESAAQQSKDDAPRRKPGLPVIVRLESEEQKKKRVAEEEREAKLKSVEEKEEQERRERLEKKIKEDEERQAKEAAEKVRDIPSIVV